MIVEIEDWTLKFTAGGGNLVLDVGANRFITFQFVGTSGTISLQGTNDGGAVLGTTAPSAATATNFISIGGYNLTAPLTVITSIAAAGLVRVDCQCKYIKLASSGATVTKLLVMTGKLL